MISGVQIIGVIVIIVLALFIYNYWVRPKPLHSGMYINPKTRRKISMLITPDGIGSVKSAVDEEGHTELGHGYSTLIVDSEGFTFAIPHVNMNRDIRPYNIKQSIAGYDAPVFVCCVDKNGLRHPEFLDTMTLPKDAPDMKTIDLEKENFRLRTDYARLKEDLQSIGHEDEFYDKMENTTDRISRLKNNLFKFSDQQGINPDEEEQQ